MTRQAPAAREPMGEEELPARPRVWESLWKDKSALLGCAILAVVVATALLAPLISPMDPHAQLLSRNLKPPLWSDGERIFLLGTDHLGRDFLSRLIYGARISLMVGFFAVLLTGGFGLLVGLVSGYFGGKVEFSPHAVRGPGALLPVHTARAGDHRPSWDRALVVLILVMSMRIWVIYARVVRGEGAHPARAGVRPGGAEHRR